MDEVHDEVGRELEQLLRVSAAAAGQLAETLARRQAGQRHAEAVGRREEARRLQEVLACERHTARAVYLAPGRSGWWDKATAADIADAWRTATAWELHDPQAGPARRAIEDQVRQRWGTDVSSLAAVDGARAGAASHQPDRVDQADDAQERTSGAERSMHAVDDAAAAAADQAALHAAAETAAAAESTVLREGAPTTAAGPVEGHQEVRDPTEATPPAAPTRRLDPTTVPAAAVAAGPAEQHAAPQPGATEAAAAHAAAGQSFPTPAAVAVQVRLHNGRRVVRAGSPTQGEKTDLGR